MESSSRQPWQFSMRLRRREVVKTLAGVSSVMGLLAACGQNPTTTSSPTAAAAAPAAATAPAAAAAAPAATTAPAAGAAPAATTAPAAAAPAAAKPTAVPAAGIKDAMKLNAGNEPDTIDPQVASFVGEIAVIMRVYSNLLTFDDKGKLVPEMATGMPNVSADGKTYTFTLKDGLKYSDGQALTAKNFEYGWKRHMDPTVANGAPGEYAFTGYAIVGAQEYNTADLKKVSKDDLAKMREAVGVKAVDDKTITFALKEAAPWFLSVLATWVGIPTRQDLIEKGGAKWTEPATYVGNGPYILKVWDHQSQMVFQANPNYVRGLAPIAKVQTLMINEPAVSFEAYKKGDLDVFGYTKEFLKDIAKDPNLTKQMKTGPGSCNFYMGFNVKKAPFDNVKVRQAFSLAIDRKSFVSDILADIGIPANQFLPPGQPGHYDDLKDTFQKQDLVQAKQLMSDAGYPGGKGFPSIKWTFGARATTQTRIEALSEQIKQALGITIGLDPVEQKAYTALVKSADTTPPLFFLGWCQDYADPQDWYTTVFRSDSTVTHVGWKDDNFDKLVTAGDHELDATQRESDYKQAGQILMDQAPVAFIFWDQTALLLKPSITGFEVHATEQFFGQAKLFSGMKFTPGA